MKNILIFIILLCSLSMSAQKLGSDVTARINNRLYKAATYSNITALTFPTLAVGDRIKVMDTGAEYLVEATTVSDYNGGAADEINVITVGSNYAVIDLSKKVKFESKEEFKTLASLMRLDGSNFQVEIGGLNYLISTAIPYLSSVHTAIEPAVDGLFIDTINVAFAGENLAPYSSVFHNKGSAYGAVFTGDGFIRGQINPEGKRTSSGLLGDASLFLYSTDAGLPAYPTGQDLTVSVWARATTGSGTSQIKLGAGTNQNVTNEWVRYTETFNNSIGAYVRIRANNSLTDTVLIDKVQIETGTELTAYKETTFLNRATSGLMYMTLLQSVIEEGVLKLDKLGGRNSSSNSTNYDDTDLIQSAIDMCDFGKVCNVVQLGKAAYTIDSITVPSNVALRGTQSEYSNIDEDQETGTIIYLKNPSGKLSAIDFQEQNGDNYISGTGLKNVLLIALDTFDTIIELEECVFSEFDNISINTDLVGHFNKGIDINTLPSSDSYNKTFNEIAITGDYDIGIEYSGQTNNIFSNLILKNALEAGIHVLNGVNLEVNNALIQGCKQAIIVDQQSGLAKFNGLYTEASGSGSSAIEINGGKVLIENSPALQPDSATDTVINHQGGILKVINSNFRVGGVLNVSSDIDKLVLDNVTSNFDLYHSIPPELLKEKVEILNNFDGNDYSIKYKDNITPSIIRNSYIKEATNSNVILSDTVTINDIYLAGKKENLVQNSDDLDIGVFGSSNITGTDEVIVDPFGNSSTVQKYQWDASFTGTIAGPNDNISPNIDIGDQYVLSFYIKSNDVIGSRKLFKVRPYNDAANDVDMYVNLSTKWQRMSVTGTINSKVNNVLSFRFYDALEIGESFYITGVQIEKGTQFGTYIQTLGTEIESTAIEITTDGIGINTEPDSTAVLDIASTSKGVLIPRMTTAQRTAIASPATGLQVYDTDTKSFWYYEGTSWIEQASGTDIFLNSVIVAGEGSHYHSNGADFSVPNGNKDAQVYIQQAADLAVARGVSTVFMDGLFTVNDSINIKPTYNLTFLGGGRANTIIYTDTTIWVPLTPVFGFDTANDTIQNLTFKDFSIRQPDNGNNGSLGNAGLITNWDNGRIENLTFDNVDFRGSGGFNSIVNFTFKTETLGTFPTYGHILVKDSHMEMDGDGKDGQYGFHCKVPSDKMTFINSNFIISGTGFGANNYNSLAAYGMGNSLVVDGCDVICDTKGHSPLAASPFRNVRISNNYVRMFEPNNVEALIEVERKAGHATSTTIDTVENFTITGNVMEMIDWETGGQTNYGVLITDRDGVGNPNTGLPGTYTPVRHGTVSGNVIKNVQNGISMNYSENVVLSGNTMVDVVNRVDRGNTDRGDAIVADSEFGALFVDAVNEKLAIYDASTLSYRDLFGLGGNNEIIFNEVLTINNAIPRVDIGDITTSVPLYLYDRIDINENGFNTLIGEEIDNVTGTNNVFQGYRTGRYATNSYNIGIGNLALTDVLFTGKQNVAVGYGAATSFETSENNVAIGYEPLFTSTSGNQNVAIGYRALNQLETSSNNVAIGYRSGYGEEGATNTFLGSFTGNTIGDSFVDGVVFLGYAVGQNNTQDNRLMIDNTNTETPLIDGDFTNDIVTINSILKIAPITAATASAITPANGMYIYVSDTDVTFTTIGFWAYENGAWVDK